MPQHAGVESDSKAVFVPDIAKAIAELKLSYVWLITPITKGGLGYTKAKAQASHIYHALVALGGSV